MMKFIVQMFGLPREATRIRQVEIELEDGANLADAIAVLRLKIPTLNGSVLHPKENRLIEHYGFNVNGRFYINDVAAARIQEGDRIALLSLATGG